MKRIYLSKTDRKITGVCGGFGEALDIDPTLIRLGVVFLCLITAVIPVMLTYVIAWLIIPQKPLETQ
jgi:phage shock protein PspC (stress-responsive transcriptional regulator)